MRVHGHDRNGERDAIVAWIGHLGQRQSKYSRWICLAGTPARRNCVLKLHSIFLDRKVEAAAERVGAGDLSARAPEGGASRSAPARPPAPTTTPPRELKRCYSHEESSRTRPTSCGRR